jgi:hypothetical protein
MSDKKIPCQCDNCSAKFVVPTLGFMKVIILMLFAAYVFGIATAYFVEGF